MLEAEAERLGVSLAEVLRRAVANEADEIRSRTRPRFGILRGDGEATAAIARDESAPARRPGRS